MDSRHVAKISNNRQIAIPVPVMRALGWATGNHIEFVCENGAVILRPVHVEITIKPKGDN